MFVRFAAVAVGQVLHTQRPLSAKSGHLLDRTGGQVQAELGQSYAETDVLHPP